MSKATPRIIAFLRKLSYNSRFWILAAGFVVSVLVPGIIQSSVESQQLQSIRTQQVYGFISLTLLYITILIAPLYKAFKSFPFENGIKHARRAFGVLAFYFALLHAYIAFFGQLGGFEGLSFLENRYGPSLLLGLVGLIILAAMAFTSTDWAIKKMEFKNWKILHRLVYAGSVAIFIHIIIIGTHYNNESQLAARITLGALLLLLALEAWRFDSYIKSRFVRLGNIRIASMLVLCVSFLGLGLIIGSNGAPIKFGGVGSADDSQPHEFHSINDSDGSRDGTAGQKQSGKYTVSLNQNTFSLRSLNTGQQSIVFSITPLASNVQPPECFLIDHDDLSYARGFTKLVASEIQTQVSCLPLGDTSPTKPGDYEVYLRLNTNDGIITVNWPVRIT